jgi:hypothetical protein
MTMYCEQLETIQLDDLQFAVGGDAWGDYTAKLGQDWKDVKSRWNEAGKYTYHNGRDPGKFAYNYAGAIFNGGKLALDAVGGPVLDIAKSVFTK